MSILTHFSKHNELYVGAATGTLVHFELTGFVTRLENIVWAVVSAVVVVTAIHFFKKLMKWTE
jgi:uncharacterized membrane protein YeaQ/YmgE (transglycosylase-associated protein family)